MSTRTKQIRAILRSALLFPILPITFRGYVSLLRFSGFLPPVRSVSTKPHRILVVNLTNHVGDVVMSLPLLERLHAEHPEILLETAVAAPMGSLLREIPFLNRVHEFDFGVPRPPLLHHYRRIWKMVRYAVRVLSTTHYDLCLLPRWGTDPNGSAYLAFMTDSPLRYGHDPRDAEDGQEIFYGSRYLMTSALRGGHGLPEAVRELRLLPAAGLTYGIDEVLAERQPTGILQMMAQKEASPALWERLGLSPGERFMVIAPGASAARRRWPLEAFAETARRIAEESKLKAIAVGSPAESALGVEIERVSAGAIRSLIGKTSLVETIAVLSAAQLFIGNDSGPAHIAGGLGVPSLVLSICSATSKVEGPSSPSLVRPVGPSVVVIQPAHPLGDCTDSCVCDLPHCILQIVPGSVVQQANNLLQRSAVSL